MVTSNFEFIQHNHPELANLCSSAEGYAHTDAQSSVVKLRCFAERYVGFIYEELALPAYGAKTFFELLDNAAFGNAVERCVLDKLHLIRMKGNSAAHVGGVNTDDALLLVKEAFFLCAWIHMAYHGGQVSGLPSYQTPKKENPITEKYKNELASAEAQLSQHHSALQQAKAELEEAQKQQEVLQARLLENRNELDQAKLLQIKEAGQRATANFDFEINNTLEAIQMADVFAEYQLTQNQTELVEKLDRFLAGEGQSVFLLKGYAGTGKTFITKGLTEYFRAIGRNYVLAAPTGKASKVIAKKTKSEAYTLHKTIYSFNDIKEYKEEQLNGSETYKFYAELAVNELSADTVYIVDEASMISDIYNESEFFRCGSGYLLRDFLKFVNLDHNDHRKKIIFIGDEAQLPPVGMKMSPALDPSYLKREYGLSTDSYELSEVVRQKASSGVMHNAIAMRNALKENVFNHLDFKLAFPDVSHVEYSDVIQHYLASCNHKINAESIIIAHSNADVTAYNQRIREEFFPGQATLCRGDKVMAISNSDSYGFFISNGDFGQIKQVLGESEVRNITIRRRSEETNEVVEIIVPLQFRQAKVAFRDLAGEVHTFEAKLIEGLLYSDNPTLSSDENKALYVDFCIRNQQLKPGTLEFKETLRSDPYFNALRLKFGYAITCHKAQGSEWNHVFVKCKTHQNQLTATYFRWLYTAITRTSSNLYLLDEPHIKLGGGIKVVGNPGINSNASSINTQKLPVNTPPLPENQTDLASLPAHAIEGGTKFGIPTGNGFLLALFTKVESLASNAHAEIMDIHHQQYQEAYFFSKGDEMARLNISYNGNQKITSINPLQPTELASALLVHLDVLKGQVIVPQVSANAVEIVFDEKFLKDFYVRLNLHSQEIGIAITNVEQKQYSQRYWFQRAAESAVIDIYYNKKKQFTSCDPKKNMSSNHELLNEVITLVTEGMA